MPDTPIDRPQPPPYDPDHEARISRLEDDMREVKSTLGQMLPVLVRIDATLSATLPHLATKAEVADLRTEMKSDFAELRVQLAEKPSKTYLWGVLATLIATYAVGLASVAVLLH